MEVNGYWAFSPEVQRPLPKVTLQERIGTEELGAETGESMSVTACIIVQLSSCTFNNSVEDVSILAVDD